MRSALLVGATQVDGRLRIAGYDMPFGPGFHGFFVVALAPPDVHLEPQQIGIVGGDFEPKTKIGERRVILLRRFVDPRQTIGTGEGIEFHRFFRGFNGFREAVHGDQYVGSKVIELGVMRIEADRAQNLAVGVGAIPAIDEKDGGHGDVRFGRAPIELHGTLGSLFLRGHGCTRIEGAPDDAFAIVVGEARPGLGVIRLDIHCFAEPGAGLEHLVREP